MKIGDRGLVCSKIEQRVLVSLNYLYLNIGITQDHSEKYYNGFVYTEAIDNNELYLVLRGWQSNLENTFEFTLRNKLL